jgi:hypothetical protein
MHLSLWHLGQDHHVRCNDGLMLDHIPDMSLHHSDVLVVAPNPDAPTADQMVWPLFLWLIRRHSGSEVWNYPRWLVCWSLDAGVWNADSYIWSGSRWYPLSPVCYLGTEGNVSYVTCLPRICWFLHNLDHSV